MKCTALVLFSLVAAATAEFIFPIASGSNDGGHPTKCLNVLFHGDACECAKALPYKLERPVIESSGGGGHYDYGYKVEMSAAPPKPTELKYSFDFEMERPKPAAAVHRLL